MTSKRNLLLAFAFLLGGTEVALVWRLGFLYGYGNITPVLVLGAFAVIVSSLASSMYLVWSYIKRDDSNR